MRSPLGSVSLPQVALAWVRARGVTPIVGARTLAQLQENLASLDLFLDDQALARLDEATSIDLGFPLEFLGRPGMASAVYGGMIDRIDTHRTAQMPENLRLLAARQQ